MITKLSIVIPAYNEEKTISLILDKVISVQLVKNIKKEIIVVNDCSKDGTKEALEKYCNAHKDIDIKALHHEVNQGKGAALHTGIKHATGEYLIIQDADDEYDPREYNDLLKPVIEGFADVVYGSRFMGGNPHRILFFWHSIGNKLLTTLSNMFTNLNLSDMETCYKLFRTDIIQSIDLKENRFGFEPEVTAKIARVPNIRIYEVGISYYGRTYADGKKIGWKDGFRAIFSILKYNVFDKKTFINETITQKSYNNKSSKLWMIVLFLVVFGYFSYLSLFNNRNVQNTWQSEFFADKAGYYIYLPATFIYGFNKSELPVNIEKDMGNGFYFNEVGKLFSKYTSGIAILIFPFFIILHLILLLFGYDASGMSPPYHNLVNLTAALYLAIGVITLFKFLKNYLNSFISLLTILILVFSTNLYYYASYETLMSHVYSFSVFAVFLYSLKRYLDFGNKTKHLFLTAISFAFAILIRPTNIFIILFIFLLDIKSFKDFKIRFLHYLKPYRILIFVVCAILVFLPQIIYWKYTTDHFIFYSYGTEGFDFWKNPKFAEILFSPLNGLLPYNPIYLIIFIGLIFSSIRYKLNGFLGLLSFIFIAYTSAAWYCFYFGCGYGMRTFVEFNALFALSFGFFLNFIFTKKGIVLKVLVSVFILYSTYFSINIENHYDRCFFGSQWDWNTYRQYFDKANILFLKKTEFKWSNDFETKDNKYTNGSTAIKEFKYATSGNHVAFLDSTNQFSSGFKAFIANISPRPIKDIKINLNILFPEKPKEMILVCNVMHGKECIFWDKIPLDVLYQKNNSWQNVKNNFNLPELDIYSDLEIYVWSPSGNSILIDDMKVNILY